MPRSVNPRRRPSISTEDRTVEHRVYGVGVMRFIKQIDDGTFAAIVNFAGIDRMVRIAPEYWLTPVDAIIKLLPLLPMRPEPQKPVEKKIAEPDEANTRPPPIEKRPASDDRE